ncbi:MAG TPA: hypothetical protein VLI46_07570 [Ramlibacter sp.]|nr:hypothetical protein [Ramlibacter sp.]
MIPSTGRAHEHPQPAVRTALSPQAIPSQASLVQAALTQAAAALWSATLSLMVAFMHNTAPAHRYLIARRIANNFATLRQQECFAPECRATFGRLFERWTRKAERLSPHAATPRTSGVLPAGWFRH